MLEVKKNKHLLCFGYRKEYKSNIVYILYETPTMNEKKTFFTA